MASMYEVHNLAIMHITHKFFLPFKCSCGLEWLHYHSHSVDARAQTLQWAVNFCTNSHVRGDGLPVPLHNHTNI